MLSALNAGEKIRSRALFNASLMDRVPESASQILENVHADGVLRHRILTRARRYGIPIGGYSTSGWFTVRRLAPVLSAAVGILLIVWFGMNSMGPNAQPPSIPENAQINMQVFPAGDLLTGQVKLAGGVPQIRDQFARTSLGDPALLSVNGRYYQMLASPLALPAEMLGTKHGDIQPLSADISLADRIGVLSNIVPEGEIVYAIGDYSTRTMVAARVSGSVRVFQRIGYAAKSLVGEESFSDTLAVSGKVQALELSGVGIINDAEQANRLIDLLLSRAQPWSGEAVPEGDQSLTIYMRDGLSLHMVVSGDIVQACGAWACPDFFEEFFKVLHES